MHAGGAGEAVIVVRRVGAYYQCPRGGHPDTLAGPWGWGPWGHIVAWGGGLCSPLPFFANSAPGVCSPGPFPLTYGGVIFFFRLNVHNFSHS